MPINEAAFFASPLVGGSLVLPETSPVGEGWVVGITVALEPGMVVVMESLVYKRSYFLAEKPRELWYWKLLGSKASAVL